MDNIFESILGIIIAIGIHLIMYSMVGSVLADAFAINNSQFWIGLIIIAIILVAAFILRRIVGKNFGKVFMITTFVISLLMSILLLTPIVGFIALWKTYNDNDVRRKSVHILITHFTVATVYTIIRTKGYNSEKVLREKRFKDNAIYSISTMLRDEIIKIVPPFLLLNSYLEIFKSLYQYEIHEKDMTWYTNDYFSDRSIELFNILDTLSNKKMKEARIIQNVFNDSSVELDIEKTFEGYYNNTPISQCFSILKGKSGEDKAKQVLDSLGILYYDSFNLKDDLRNESVEIDFITVLGGTIYAIEVKDYSADTIILESSGQFIRQSGDYTYNLDTLKQISRHNEFLRTTIGSSMDIKNLIVLTDKETLVQDNFKSENVKVIYIDALPFLIGKNQSEADKAILLELNNYRTQAKRFKFFNIDNVLSDFNKLMEAEAKYMLSVDDLQTNEYIHKFKIDMEELILTELKKIEGYSENKKQIKNIVEELSNKAVADYKSLLGVATTN